MNHKASNVRTLNLHEVDVSLRRLLHVMTIEDSVEDRYFGFHKLIDDKASTVVFGHDHVANLELCQAEISKDISPNNDQAHHNMFEFFSQIVLRIILANLNTSERIKFLLKYLIIIDSRETLIDRINCFVEQLEALYRNKAENLTKIETEYVALINVITKLSGKGKAVDV